MGGGDSAGGCGSTGGGCGSISGEGGGSIGGEGGGSEGGEGGGSKGGGGDSEGGGKGGTGGNAGSCKSISCSCDDTNGSAVGKIILGFRGLCKGVVGLDIFSSKILAFSATLFDRLGSLNSVGCLSDLVISFVVVLVSSSSVALATSCSSSFVVCSSSGSVVIISCWPASSCVSLVSFNSSSSFSMNTNTS